MENKKTKQGFNTNLSAFSRNRYGSNDADSYEVNCNYTEYNALQVECSANSDKKTNKIQFSLILASLKK